MKHKVISTYTKVTVYSKLSRSRFVKLFSDDKIALSWLVQTLSTRDYTYTISRIREVNYFEDIPF